MSCGVESDGRWRSFELAVSSPGALSLRPMSSPLRLAGLSFIESTSKATTLHRSSRPVSLLSLGSSLVVLCSGISQSQDLVLLLWDLRYSVVLASHRFSIPAKLSTSKGVSLGLIPASNTLALLSVSSGPVNKSPKTSSAVLAVPVTAPATSTIANAMGRASSSAQWLAKSEALFNGNVPHAAFNSDRRDLLDKLRTALRQSHPEAADSAFFEWLEKHSSSSATIDTQHIEQGDLLFGHEFVREILDIVLQSPSKSAATLYPAKTVRHLLENRVVTASMLSQSLLGLLVERKDWVSGAHPSIHTGQGTQFSIPRQHAIELAFKNVPDLPEDEVIKLLRFAQNNNRPAEEHDVQVGSTRSDTPTLRSILVACVSYHTSDAALCMAMREQLNLAEVIMPILAILDDWLVTLSSHGMSLILNANVANVGENVPSVEAPARPCSGKVEIPPLDKVSPELLPNTYVDSDYTRYWHFYVRFSTQHS